MPKYVFVTGGVTSSLGKGITAASIGRILKARGVPVSILKLDPGFRMPFGHKHSAQEEVYVVVRGSGRVKVDDEVVELREWDAIRFDKDTMRNVEAGSDGIEYLAFGAGTDPTDAEMTPGWWSG